MPSNIKLKLDELEVVSFATTSTGTLYVGGRETCHKETDQVCTPITDHLMCPTECEYTC